MSNRPIIYVISGTHWDREWRFTAEQSLLRLAELVDVLLNVLENNNAYPCFLLDGGTVIMEDYLAIRPENEQRLKALFKAKRIQTVMWYTLPEMSTVAPEALIRNLLIGKKMADQFGGAIKTGYTATSYGQISQLAQIYSGFGVNTVMSYRGTNKYQVPPICKLEGPDGSRVYHIRCFDEVTRTNWFFYPHYMLVLDKLARDLGTKWNPEEWPIHMADQGLYETAIQLKNENMDFNTDPEKIKKAVRMLVNQAKPQCIGDNLLALDMEDNAVPYVKLPEMIKKINETLDDYLIKQSSLDEYVESCLNSIDDSKLHTLKGEMRFTLIEAGFNGLLGATHSSRIDLKLMNDLAQRELINIAEPLSAMSSVFGGSYETTLLDRAWLYLLKNQAHDSICGAAISEAHDDNPGRFRSVISLAKECSRKACEEIWSQIDTAGIFEQGDLTLTFFNTLPIRKRGVELVVIDAPKPNFGEYKIEPCTGAGPIVEGFNPDEMVTFQYFDIFDESGNKIPFKILERENIDLEVERKLDSNAAVYDILRNRILLEVDVPPMGYKTYAVRPRKRHYVTVPKPHGSRPLIASNNRILENEYLKISIDSNGTVDVLDKNSGRQLHGLHYFCDDASTGNAHKHKGTLRNFTVTSLGEKASLTLIENNTLRASWKIDLEMSIPDCAELSSRNRSHTKTTLPISTTVTLKKGSKLVEVKTAISNQARDHRLRVMFPTHIDTDYAYADAAFDVIKRSVLWEQVGDNVEEYHPFKPMQRFVTVSDDKEGFSFISKGLGEYEVIDDPQRTLAITLLRTSRAYMRANRGLMTPEEYCRNLGQHCLGTIEYEYAICLHKGNWDQGGIHLAADSFRLPMRAIQGVSKKGLLPLTQSLFILEPAEDIQVSAFYKSSLAGGYILRLWNTKNKDVNAKIQFNINITSAQLVSMDEQTIQETLKVNNSVIELKITHSKIVTLLVKTRDKDLCNV
ncbi:MAG: hypothetical protein A2Y12_18340 [Planctomycetes bacterium GWF2_42_9]|nr:MAG: hypothetical protein A2Y12_18340 [Planctomycetes bacterium GWF2_42_9]